RRGASHAAGRRGSRRQLGAAAQRCEPPGRSRARPRGRPQEGEQAAEKGVVRAAPGGRKAQEAHVRRTPAAADGRGCRRQRLGDGGGTIMAAGLETPNFRSVAEKIVRDCAGVRPGQVVQIGGGIHNFGFLAAVAAAVRRAGAFPELNVTSDDLQVEMLTTTPLEHLRALPEHRLRWLEDVDVIIATDAVENPQKAESVPEERRLAALAAAKAMERHIFERGVRWVYVGWPTPAATPGLALPFAGFWPMFWRAVDVDYRQLAAEAASAAAILEVAEEVRIVSERGTDLTLRLAGRPVLVDDGVISDEDVERGDTAATLPAGKVFVAPQEDSAAG